MSKVICNKKSFSKKYANEIVNRHSAVGRQFEREKRAYYCEEHNAWHLTSTAEYFGGTKNAEVSFKDKWSSLINNENV
jgi:hypothetical protein